MRIYLIGSLRNPKIPEIAQQLRAAGFDVFDDWHAAGPNADDEWKRYEQERGHNYVEALVGESANHTFWFDKTHLDDCTVGVLVLPAGRSGHLELGYLLGKGTRGYILLREQAPERWDVMYLFADGVFTSLDALVAALG